MGRATTDRIKALQERGYRPDEAAAKVSGMSVERWHAAQVQVQAARTRGRVAHRRPESSLSDAVAGQAPLFGE
jgi:hypothetical protein